MIAYDEALRIVLETVKPLRPVAVPVEDSLGLVLAQPLKAKLRMPRYDQSAMDGIAVRVEDVAAASDSNPASLRLIDEIPAGSPRRPSLKPGTAIKVFTGSGVPKNADAVVMVEYCRFEGDRVGVMRAAKSGDHVRLAGEEVERGDTVLEPGVRITPPVIGLLSLFGYERVKAHPAPSVGVITMGDELAAPGTKLGRVQIYDSNGPALRAALHAMGIRQVRNWRVGDRPAELKRAFRAAIRACDVVLSVGGASVGDHDHVEAARNALGVSALFARVAIKPGKPNVFGLAPSGVPVFSLPGNPVSALVSFRQIVRPGLLRLMGGFAADPARWAALAVDHRRKSVGSPGMGASDSRQWEGLAGPCSGVAHVERTGEGKRVDGTSDGNRCSGRRRRSRGRWSGLVRLDAVGVLSRI
jgi:molybdopterin molybdotransferase